MNDALALIAQCIEQAERVVTVVSAYLTELVQDRCLAGFAAR